MNKSAILFIAAIIAITLTGCWSSADGNANGENANIISSSAANSDASANIRTNIDVNVVNEPPANSGDPNKQPYANVQSNKVGNHIKSGEPGVISKEMKDAENNRPFTAGPENSKITGEMNKDGNPVQTRKFLNHPTIDKVEIVSYSAETRKEFVYLKNGKVLPIEPGKVDNLMYASSYQILKAVGIESKAPAQTDVQKKQ